MRGSYIVQFKFDFEYKEYECSVSEKVDDGLPLLVHTLYGEIVNDVYKALIGQDPEEHFMEDDR